VLTDGGWVGAAAIGVGVVGAVVRITGTGVADEPAPPVAGATSLGIGVTGATCRITGGVVAGMGAAAGVTEGRLPPNCLLILSPNRDSAGADTVGRLQAGVDVLGSRIGANLMPSRSGEGMVWMAGAAVRSGLIQEGKGNKVARTTGKPVEPGVVGVAAALKSLAAVPGFRERNSTPIVACRRTLCTSGFIPLNRDNDNLTTSYL
jgi:hypothetical protein